MSQAKFNDSKGDASFIAGDNQKYKIFNLSRGYPYGD
jgi:hypothetical protein